MMGFQAFFEALRSREKRSGAMAITVVVILLFSAGAGARPAVEHRAQTDGPDAGPVPVLSLSLFPSQLQAQVSQSQLGAVTFGGNATVEQMRIMTSTVTLTVVCNTGWPTVLSPQTIEFTGSGTERFQVTVIVPPATSAMLTGNVIVTGQCKAPGLAPVVAAASAVVTVAAYQLARIISSDGEVTVDGGEEKDIKVQVWNDGNSEAQMRIFVVNKPKEIRVSFSETEFRVQQDENHTITVTVGATPSAESGSYLMGLVVEADTRDGGTEQVASYNLSVYVPSLKSKLGVSGINTIIIVVIVVVGVVVLWRMGRLQFLKDVKVPRRSKS
jgi:uncharacterized membrane protein